MRRKWVTSPPDEFNASAETTSYDNPFSERSSAASARLYATVPLNTSNGVMGRAVHQLAASGSKTAELVSRVC
jgi:hypothetical protein